MANVREIKFDRYTIKVMQVSDGFGYAVFTERNERIHNGVEETEDIAIETAKSWVTNRNREREANRQNGIPTAEEFAEALTAVKPNDGQWEMLKAHYNAPERKLTSEQLAEAANYEDKIGAHGQYGVLGHKLSDYLGYMPPETYRSGEPLWITILVAGGSSEEDTGHYQHKMRDEVAEALEILGAI